MKYKCPKCGTIFEEGTKFCPGCGVEIKISNPTNTTSSTQETTVKKYKCPVCGAIHDKPVKFCNECGTELKFGDDDTKTGSIANKSNINGGNNMPNQSVNDPVNERAPERKGNPVVGWIFVVVSFFLAAIGLFCGVAAIAVSLYDILDQLIGLFSEPSYAELIGEIREPVEGIKAAIDGIPVVSGLIAALSSFGFILLLVQLISIIATFIFAGIGKKNGGKVFNVFAIIFNIFSIMIIFLALLLVIADKAFGSLIDQIIEIVNSFVNGMGGFEGASEAIRSMITR